MIERKTPKTPGTPGTNWPSMFKNLALWLLVIFAGLTLFQVMNNQRNPTQEFSYTEFTKQLESGPHPRRAERTAGEAVYRAAPYRR
jgi:hypothetical protein